MEKISRRDFLFVAPGALAVSAALPAEAKTYPISRDFVLAAGQWKAKSR